MAKLNKWIEHGVRMKGGKDPLGFVFLYELMTNTLNLRIRPSDSTHSLAMLLMRLMPPQDTQKEDTLMSALRVMADNPYICLKMPKYVNKRAMFKASVWVDLVVGIKESLDQAVVSKTLTLSDGAFEEYTESPMIIGPSLEDLHRADRSMLAPRIHNLECAERTLRPVEPVAAPSGTPLGMTAAQLGAFRDLMLEPIGVPTYTTDLTLRQRGREAVSPELPFAVGSHPASKAHVAVSMVNRLTADMKWYAEQENGSKMPKLREFLDADVAGYVQDPTGAKVATALAKTQALTDGLERQMDADYTYVLDGIKYVLDLCNNPPSPAGAEDTALLQERAAFALATIAGRETKFWFELLVALPLSTTGLEELQSLNPHLGAVGAQQVQDMTVAVMLTANRLGHIMRCLQMCGTVVGMLTKLQRMTTEEAEASAFAQNLSLNADTLAMNLTVQRHFVSESLIYDPRFLTFEFTYNMVLRNQQCRLIRRFMEAMSGGESICHQMIMGAGKTTVVGPMLALLLADGHSLITQVVPNQLLDMSRGVMREKFTAVVQKPVFTFVFERQTSISDILVDKLVKARDSRAVVCSTPTAIKSFVLKFVEMLHTLEFARTKASDQVLTDEKAYKKAGLFGKMAKLTSVKKQRTFATDEIKVMRVEAKNAKKIVALFNLGVLMLDEVDLILHPMKSELNWPLGDKKPIDLTQNRAGLGLRWNIPFVMMDAVFYYTECRTTTGFTDSREAADLLEELRKVIDEGCANKDMQKIPHLLVLNRKFYDKRIMPLLAQWMLLWLRHKRVKDVSDETAVLYLTKGPNAGSEVVSEVLDNLSDEHVKMLNLTHDWLTSFAPFVMAKVNRVGYGLLTVEQVDAAMSDPNCKMPRSRTLVAVPFMGKDVPTRASEFSHPDVVIGLTILAYRYEGMRTSDFMAKLQVMREEMIDQYGPYHEREANLQFRRFVELAGGRVRGTKLQADIDAQNEAAATVDRELEKVQLVPEYDGVWPLHLVDLDDPEQIDLLYRMLSSSLAAAFFAALARSLSSPS
eukprot:COSAG01_NODE_5810_length_4020_cov_2.216526_2_plen_1030_part_00